MAASRGLSARSTGEFLRVEPYGVELWLVRSPGEMLRAVKRHNLSFMYEEDGSVRTDAVGSANVSVWTEKTGYNQPVCVLYVNMEALVLENGSVDVGEVVDTIAHEAFHTSAQIMEQIKQAYVGPNDEALAYLIGYISKWAYLHCIGVGG